jgi:hypothetical protein
MAPFAEPSREVGGRQAATLAILGHTHPSPVWEASIAIEGQDNSIAIERQTTQLREFLHEVYQPGSTHLHLLLCHGGRE